MHELQWSCSTLAYLAHFQSDQAHYIWPLYQIAPGPSKGSKPDCFDSTKQEERNFLVTTFNENN